MIPYTIQCSNCGEHRTGRKTEEGIEPIRATCPKCGDSDFDVLANID